MKIDLRPVHWVGSSRDDLRELPEDVKDVVGKALLQVQFGGKPHNASVLHGFGGANVLEIKDDYDGDTYRCVYTVRFAEAVYVLHTFQKKSRSGIKTSQQDIDAIKLRLDAAMKHYKAHYGNKEQKEEENGNRDSRGKR
ncbi:MAG: phage-related protein [Chthonomonadaceae bacterium]|nr:phage-related protein [Chthonomonadaceae bacterium]